jgi:large subunit ribosomal protein L31e
MVCKSMKGKILGKEKKLALLAARQKATEASVAREDKKWKRVLAKMTEEKRKSEYRTVGVVERGRRRGATRAAQRERKGRKADSVTYEATIHLSKLLQGKLFAKRAPMAVKKIKTFAQKMLKTKDNRIDGGLNTLLWSRGVKGVPTRIRVRLQRKVKENTDGNSKRKQLYTVISHVPTATLKGLTTKIVEATA